MSGLGRIAATAGVVVMVAAGAGREAVSARAEGPWFEVAVAPAVAPRPVDGRLIVVLGRRPEPAPRLLLGEPSGSTPAAIAVDVSGLDAAHPATLDATALAFPNDDARRIPAGRYHVQAVLTNNPDSREITAPGNLFSAVQAIDFDPAAGTAIRVTLDRAEPPETLPADTNRVKYLKLPSRHLSEFYGRPMFVRAGVILPRDFESEPDRRYSLRVHIGGYGTRYTVAGLMMEPDSGFRAAWDADDAPRFVLLHLDGDGPLGDPYQVDSANHGPYGRALMEELIPAVERRFRCGGEGRRVLDGGSTGGWVALALQVFYPDAFAGAWGFCPDPVDFRSFQKINIYEDENAYVASDGSERPSSRERDGTVRLTMRRECAMENLMGLGGQFTMSGGQWGAWNSTFGARGADGRPVPLWDPRTGVIDRAAAEHWAKYDLRRILQRDAARLVPKLAGKLRIWVGEADDYYLNEAVRRFEAALGESAAGYRVAIAYGPRRGHCWMGISQAELLRQMAVACGDAPAER